MKSFEYSGVWWLPENPDVKVAGVVTFSQENGIELKLIGAFDTFERRENFNNYPIILGVPVSGKLITLHNCLMRNRTYTGFSLKLGGSCKFLVHTAYIGVHLSTDEQFSFDKASVTYTHLTDWIADTSGLKHDFQREETSDSYKEIITYEYPKEVKAETTKANISLAFTTSGSIGIHEYTLEEKAQILIDNFGNKTLEEARKEFIYPLGNLISFLTDKYNFVEELQLFSKDFYIERDDERIPESIEVFYSQNFYRSSKSLHPMEMILYYEQIADNLPQIFENWLRSAEELDAVFNSYFWLQGAEKLSLEERFSILIRAIEIYHRRRKNNEVLPKNEHKEKKEEIISSAPEAHKQWLKERLAFSNEPTLKNRLRELIEESEGLILPLIGDKDSFIKLVGDTRNYYTHYGEGLIGKAAKGSELIQLSEKLLFLLKSCLFNEIGISIEKQIDIFSRNSKYNFAKSKVEAVKDKFAIDKTDEETRAENAGG